jgi:hypothetical protein
VTFFFGAMILPSFRCRAFRVFPAHSPVDPATPGHGG